MREIDEPIPEDEELYREISAMDVDGEGLYMEAVDLQGMSVSRRKYRHPEEIVPGRPERNGLAVITPGMLPTDIEDSQYVFFAKDLPIDENEAHAEIWPGRAPSAERPHGDRDRQKPWSPGRPLREKMRLALAQRFRIYRAPSQVAVAEREPAPVEKNDAER